MHNRDEVIRQASIASDNHAGGVRKALAAMLRREPDEETATRALRDALVAQAAGFEDCAHDGATFATRKAAAAAALEAWDGPEPESYIVVAGYRLPCNDPAIRGVLAFGPPYANDATRTARPCSGFQSAHVAEIATALSEGLRGEAALLRAVAIVQDARPSQAALMAERQIADARLHAARVERQAAIVSARARGLSAADIEKIVR